MDPAVFLFMALGAFTFSFAGFGFALMVVPLLSLLLPVKIAVAFQFPYAFALVIYHTWKYGRKVSWKKLRSLTLAALLVMPVGLLSLNYFPESILKKSLASFTAIMVLWSWLSSLAGASPIKDVPAIRGSVWGIISGWFQGAYCTGGPPAVIYIMSVSDDPKEAKGLMSDYFIVTFILTAVLFGLNGMFSVEQLLEALKYCPAVIGGTLIGSWAFGKANDRIYRRVVDILLLTASVILWVRS